MVSINDRQSDVLLDGNSRPKGLFTRNDVISRGFSPIIGDPTMLPTQTTDPISQKEIDSLKAINVEVNGEPIGSGQHAIIYSGSFVDKATQQTVHCAVKRSFSFRQAWAELEALDLFGHQTPHKNIVNYYGFYRKSIRMYLFIELSKIGDLSHYLSSEYGSKGITEAEMYHLFRHISKGLTYLHDNGYAHRDIKIHNVLVFTRQRKVVCKLCDFGSTRRYESGDQSRTVIGSPKTMAPEVCDTPYDAKIADVYSLGVILYQLSHDGHYPIELNTKHDNTQTPFVVEKYAEYKRHPKNIKWSNNLSPELRELLKKMLEPDPNRRIHLKAIHESRWAANHRSGGHHSEGSHSSGSYESASAEGGRYRSSRSDQSNRGSDNSSYRTASTEGGRYRSSRSEQSSSGGSDYRSARSGSGSESRKKSTHKPKLDQNPYASGKERKRHSPSSFFEK